MAHERTHSRRGRPGRWRLFAAVTGLLAGTVLFGPEAVARDGAPTVFSTAQLSSAGRALDRSGVTGIAWAVDRKAGVVQVLADDTVRAAQLAQLRSAAGPLADALRVERTPGRLAERGPLGGDGFRSSLGPCTFAFNVRIGSGWYVITVGHCILRVQYIYERLVPWPPPEPPLGQVVRADYPGNDFGLIRYLQPPQDALGSVNLHNGTVQDITTAGDPALGQSVCFSGSTSGRGCGQVTGLNWTVSLAGGSVHGLIRTNICSAAGDSGGPLFAGTTGLGMASVGSGSCATGGVTFFQPLGEALATYGATVY
ncbi:S1 family peptidase [Streptomyces tsukubensis]|uniref:S1 family peptidase n=1 Tax=Streptomyces tsukubensis TaxID=83656 RepID=UPI0036A25EA0